MKKIVSIVCLIAILAVSAVMPAAAEGNITINVFNWGQYMALGEDDTINVNEEFTKATGIKVNYMTYEDNESLYTKLKNGGASYDVIFPSDYMVEKLIKADMLEKLDFDNIPNFNQISQDLKNPSYDPQNEYSVPYTAGTMGLIYNKKYVTKPVDSWNLMWDADYKGKILMFANPRDAFSIAQFLLGIDVNTTDLDELQKAADKLTEQKPLVQSYVMDQIFEKMENEEAYIAAYYAGDAVTMMAENENLAFVHPKEGFNRFVDAMCVPKGCKNKAAAEAYINFMTDAEICAANLEYLGYTTPNINSKEFLPEEYAQNEIIFPTDEELARAKVFHNLPDETYEEMDSMFLKVRNSGNGNLLVYTLAAVVVAAVVIFLILRSLKKKKLYTQED